MRRFLVLALAVGLCLLTAAVTARVVSASTQSTGQAAFSTTRTFSLSFCPSGWKLTGGGAGPLPGNFFGSYSSTEYALTGSYPSAFGWRATGTVTRGTYSSTSGWRYYTSPYTPRVYVVCAR